MPSRSSIAMRRPLWRWCSVVLLSLSTSADAAALPELTPEGAGLVIEVNDLAGSLDAFLDGPLYDRLQEFRPWSLWRQKHAPDLRRLARQAAEQLETPAEDLWRGFFGRSALLAVWPKRSDTGDEGIGLALVDGESPALTERVLGALREAQARGEGVRWERRSHASGDYFVAFPPGKENPAAFMAALGSVAALSNDGNALLAAMDLASDGAAGSLAASAWYPQAAGDSLPRPTLRLLVNPRPWDAALEREIGSAPGERQAEKRAFLALWRGVQSGTVSVELDRRLRLLCVARLDEEALPNQARQALAAFSGEAKLFDKTPANALMAVTARCDLAALARLSGEDVPPLVERILALLGGEFGGYVLGGADDARPWQWLIAARLADSESLTPETQALLHETLPAALNLLSALRGAVSEDTASENIAPHEGDVAAGVPGRLPSAFATSQGYFWAASSSRALPGERTGSVARLAESPRFHDAVAPQARPISGAFYLDVRGLRELLDEHGDRLVATLSRSGKPTAEAAQRGLHQLQAVLRLADTVVLATRLQPGVVAIGLDVTAE